MKQAFVEKLGMSKGAKLRLMKINEVIEEYAAQGYKLTLRQLYYQLVSQNIIANDDKEYTKLSILLTKGRMAGIVDWDAIEDRIRQPRHTYFNKDVADALNDAMENYRLDRMEEQANYIELWVEKDAISNVLQHKTTYYHVRLMVNRGYSSTTAMYDSYERFEKALLRKQKVKLLYLGDHDPSGLDMVRDIYERLFVMLTGNPKRDMRRLMDNVTDKELQVLAKKYRGEELAYRDGELDALNMYILDNFTITHIGLTSEQVRLYNPPPNPTKITDPRAAKYIEKHGNTSWEVDALNPTILHQIIDTNIEALIDMPMFKAMLEREKVDIEELRRYLTMGGKVDNIKELLDSFNIPNTLPETKPVKPLTIDKVVGQFNVLVHQLKLVKDEVSLL